MEIMMNDEGIDSYVLIILFNAAQLHVYTRSSGLHGTSQYRRLLHLDICIEPSCLRPTLQCRRE